MNSVVCLWMVDVNAMTAVWHGILQLKLLQTCCVSIVHAVFMTGYILNSCTFKSSFVTPQPI